jgi:hypothetical protein
MIQCLKLKGLNKALYHLNDDPVKRGVLRHDLLRIDDRQEIPEDAKRTHAHKIENTAQTLTTRLASKTQHFQIV